MIAPHEQAHPPTIFVGCKACGFITQRTGETPKVCGRCKKVLAAFAVKNNARRAP